MKHVLVLLGVIVLLSACLDVDTTIDVRRDGSGTVDIRYVIDEELYHLGVFDDSDTALPIPISRSDFEAAAAGVEGLRLRRYRMHQDAGLIQVEARLAFDSAAGLSRWYGGGAESITLKENGDGWVWSQLIAPGSGDLGPAGDAFAESLDGYNVRFELHPPEKINAANIGTVSDDGRTVVLEYSLREIASTTEEIRWVVEWQ